MRAEDSEKKVSKRKRNVVLGNILDPAGAKRVVSTRKKNKEETKKDHRQPSTTSHELLGVVSRRRKSGKAMGAHRTV